MRSDRERLRDALEAIEAVEKYARLGEDKFASDELVQCWIVRHLQILGEAIARLSDGFRQEHPDSPWKSIIGMRNILVHDYFGIDLDIVWAVVVRDLPVLKRNLSELIEASYNPDM